MLTGDVLSFRPDLGSQRGQSRFNVLETAGGRYREMLSTTLFLLFGSAHRHSALLYSGMIE